MVLIFSPPFGQRGKHGYNYQPVGNTRNFLVPPLYLDHSVEVVQALAWGDVRQERTGPPDTMFATTGRSLYLVGDIDGGFRPRSNSYDLYNFGGPDPGDPLANELQGVWAQPVKALDGYVYVVEVDGQKWPLLDAQHFTQTFGEVRFDYQNGDLQATREDFAAQDIPVLFTTLTLCNIGMKVKELQMAFFAYFDLEDAWFTSLSGIRNQGEVVQAVNGHFVAQAHSAPDAWAVAVGCSEAGAGLRVVRGTNGEWIGRFEFSANLAAGEARSWTFAVTVETVSGAAIAMANLNEWLPQYDTLRAAKQALYARLLSAGPRLVSPHAWFDTAFDIARANMQMLETESPILGRYLYGSLEMFPFWFASDAYYCLPALMAANLVTAAQNHVLIGTRFDQYGRIPHQISPSGRIVAGGNAPQTPQWVMALWQAYRWTGDRDFLAAAYSTAVEGSFDYTLGKTDSDGDGYPEGPGMVERHGMGSEKVDSASYLWAALLDLAMMAEVLGDNETAARAQTAAAALQANFDADWWLASEDLYADSLQDYSHQPQYGGQWSTVVPLEVGIAPAEHARVALMRIRRDYLNEWGLVHTAGSDDRVWTVPTTALSRGAFRYGDAELGLAMLQNVARTLDHGSIGMFHELIPEGLSFLQLWSAATFVRGVVEDLMGIMVRADLHAATIAPQLPASWAMAELKDLRFGDHIISVCITHTGIKVTHNSGQVPLSITCRVADGSVFNSTLTPDGTFSTHEQGDTPTFVKFPGQINIRRQVV